MWEIFTAPKQLLECLNFYMLEFIILVLFSLQAKRFELFKKLQLSIQQLWTDLEVEPTTPLERTMCAEQADDHFPLSTSNLEQLTSLQTRVSVILLSLTFLSIS